MRISFRYRHVDFAWFAAARLLFSWRTHALVLLAGVGIAFLQRPSDGYLKRFAFAAFCYGFILISCLFLYPLAAVFQVRRAALDEQTVEIQDEGLCWSSSLGVAKINWSAFAKVTRRPGFVELSVKGTEPLLIPVRAFADTAQASSFLVAVRQQSKSTSDA
jgi:hypothetical protein